MSIIQADNFNLFSPLQLTNAQQAKVKKIWGTYDLFPERSSNEYLCKEQNKFILEELNALGITKITQELFDKQTLIYQKQLIESINVPIDTIEHIQKYLNKYPKSGLHFKILENNSIIENCISEVDWLPNVIGNRNDFIYLNVIVHNNIVWLVISELTTIKNVVEIGIDDYFQKNDIFLPKNRLVDILMNVNFIDEIFLNWKHLYSGRRQLCLNNYQFINVDIGNMLIFLYRLSKKLELLDLENNIVFETYDPRITKNEIVSEWYKEDSVLLQEDILEVNSNEFYNSFKKFNMKLTPDLRKELIQRYGNTLYTILNDYGV